MCILMVHCAIYYSSKVIRRFREFSFEKKNEGHNYEFAKNSLDSARHIF